MADTLFQWPGGKSGQYKRIKKMMPHHECFVEAFGGSGAVMLNKPKAEVNVYNDLDSDLTHFFLVYREAGERLCEWLEGVPYSSEVYHDFAEAFYGWDDPESEHEPPAEPLTDNLVFPENINHGHIQRAGIFFTLRYMQFGAKYHGKSGFGRSKVQNGAATFSNAKERLKEFIGVWDDVTIENVSFEKLEESYDSEDTFYYFDPPYIGTENYYRESDFDHVEFVEFLQGLEGKWIVSYDTIPDELEGVHVTQEESTNFIDSGVKGEGKSTVESLICNYDPDSVQGWSASGQTNYTSGEWQTGNASAMSESELNDGDVESEDTSTDNPQTTDNEKRVLFRGIEENGDGEETETSTEQEDDESGSGLVEKLQTDDSEEDSGGFLEDAI